MKGLAAWVAALPPRLQDFILAVALIAADVATLLSYRSTLHPAGAAIALIVAQNLPLTWRRKWPVAALLLIGLARVSYDLIGFGYAPLPLGPAIGYYTVMSQCSRRTRQIVSVLVLCGIITSQITPGHTEPYDFAVAAMIFVAAGTAGALKRAYVHEVESRVASAQAQHDLEVAAAAARERGRIARELHDVVAHHVSLMAVQAEAAASLLPGHAVAAGRSVDVIADTARQALLELRRLLGVLRGPDEQPQISPSPTLADLDTVLDQVRLTGLSVDLHIVGTPCPLAPGIDVTAYRIIQEALTNTIRHSPAAQAGVTLSYQPGSITVSVADSGRPLTKPAPASDSTGAAAPMRAAARTFAASRTQTLTAGPHNGTTTARGRRSGQDMTATGGFGLAGITERVASCGGNLSVGPTPSGGFLITARLPTQ